MPTRTGYVFLGWHGRNIINLNNYSLYDYGESFSIDGDKFMFKSRANATDIWHQGTVIISMEDLSVGYYSLSMSKTDSSNNLDNFYICIAGERSSDRAKVDIVEGSRIGVTGKEKKFFYPGERDDISFIKGTFYCGVTLDYGTIFNSCSVSVEKLMLTKVSSENEYVAYEPYYIESDTVFGTPVDRTLTAMWSSENILTGGALQTEGDLAQWEQNMGDPDGNTTSGVANVVTENGYVCTKINVAFNNVSYIAQSIKDKYEIQRLYSVTAKVKLKNMIAGVYDANYDYYTTPWIELYFGGHDTSGEWLFVMEDNSLTNYNNKGWVNVRFVCMTHPGDYGSVTASQVHDAFAYVFLRNYAGDFYIRDFAIAKM